MAVYVSGLPFFGNLSYLSCPASQNFQSASACSELQEHSPMASGAGSSQLGIWPKAPCRHCMDKSGRCQSRRFVHTSSRCPCARGPASRNSGHLCLDHTWLRQPACPRTLGLHFSLPLYLHMALDMANAVLADASRLCSRLHAWQRHGTPPQNSARHPHCSRPELRRPDRSLHQPRSSPQLTSKADTSCVNGNEHVGSPR